MKFKINIQETPEHNWFDREVMGMKWWWSTQPEGRWVGSEYGYARSEGSARKKARKAVADIANRLPCGGPIVHTYEVEVEK